MSADRGVTGDGENPDADPAVGRRGRVLIVDDTQALCELLALLVQAAGLTVTATVDNGRDAVELARAQQPDGVVLDQEMPELDGVSALPLIRDAAPDAIVVMFSSSKDVRVIERALTGGAAAYFRKGVDSAQEVVEFLRARIGSPGSR